MLLSAERIAAYSRRQISTPSTFSIALMPTSSPSTVQMHSTPCTSLPRPTLLAAPSWPIYLRTAAGCSTRPQLERSLHSPPQVMNGTCMDDPQNCGRQRKPPLRVRAKKPNTAGVALCKECVFLLHGHRATAPTRHSATSLLVYSAVILPLTFATRTTGARSHSHQCVAPMTLW